MNLKLIYDKSPYWLKYILVNLKAYSNRRKRYNKYYDQIYSELINNSNSSREQICNYQKVKLRQLLIECYEYSEYYKEIFTKLNITRTSINLNPYKVLNQLPLLSKDDVRNNTEKIVNNHPKRKITTINYTSGTTGVPSKTFFDKESEAYSFALWERFHYMIGLNKGDRHIRFSYNAIITKESDKNIFWILNTIDKQLLMSVYHLHDKNLSYYVKKIIEFKPVYIDGSPSAIAIIAEYINKNKIILDFKLKGICTTAETLFESQRNDIQKAFSCKVFNQYASSEGSPFITECKDGKLHLNEDSGVFEVLDENNNPTKPGGLGRLVVTSLRSWKSPLIRFDIQDYVELNEDFVQCSCGSAFKTIKSIMGRANDLFWFPNKGFIRTTYEFYMESVKGIDKFQMIQESPYSIRVLINKVDGYDRKINEEIIVRGLKKDIDPSIIVTFDYTTDIVNNEKGKQRTVRRIFEISEYK